MWRLVLMYELGIIKKHLNWILDDARNSDAYTKEFLIESLEQVVNNIQTKISTTGK